MKTNIASIPITLNNITIEITEQRIPTTIFNTKPVIANDAENIKPMIFKPMDNKQIAINTKELLTYISLPSSFLLDTTII